MSHKLPVLSGREIIRALMKLGYYVRGRESSHVHLRHPAKNPLTVPDHKEVARGTLRAIIRQADLSKQEFMDLID